MFLQVVSFPQVSLRKLYAPYPHTCKCFACLILLDFMFGDVTGISGSSPDMRRWFRFKLERAPYRYILLVVNDLIRKTVRGVSAVMTFRNLSQGKSFINCLVGRSFATECFCMKQRGVVIVEDMIHLVAAPVCSFSVSLISCDLN